MIHLHLLSTIPSDIFSKSRQFFKECQIFCNNSKKKERFTLPAPAPPAAAGCRLEQWAGDDKSTWTLPTCQLSVPEQSKRRERATHKPDQRSNSQHPFPIRPFQPISPIFCNCCSDVRWERCTFCTVTFLGGAGRRTHVDRFLRRLSTPMASSAINLPNILFQTTTIKASCARNSPSPRGSCFIIKAYLGTDVVHNINLRKSLSRRLLLRQDSSL